MTSKPWKRYGAAAGLVASGVVAGAILAGTLSASADDGSTDTGSSTSRSDVDPSQPQRSDEALLTGDIKSQVEAAVLAEYPDATIERTETDSDGVYESHIVTTDGERLTVLVGEDFSIRCRVTKLRSSSRAPRGMPAQKPAGRDVVGPAGVVVTSGVSAGRRVS